MKIATTTGDFSTYCANDTAKYLLSHTICLKNNICIKTPVWIVALQNAHSYGILYKNK